MRKICTLVLVFLSLFTTKSATSQVVMVTNGNYTQNFDNLSSTGGNTNRWKDDSVITSWYAQRTGTGNTYTAGIGNSLSGALYSFGDSASSERAFGTVGSGTVGNLAIGLLLQNTSGFVISDIKVSYTMEQWRTAKATPDTLTFWYKVSSSRIDSLNPNTNATWSKVLALCAASPTLSPTASALNGNLPANKVVLTDVQIPGLSIPDNSFIMIKWDDPNNSGSDHGMSIDDVTVTWTTSTVLAIPTVFTEECDQLTSYSATLHGRFASTDCPSISHVGIEYSPNPLFGYGAGIKAPSTDLNNGNFSSTITGLKQNTIYYYKSYVRDCNDSNVYGELKYFKTLPIPAGLTISANPLKRGGNVHYTLSGMKPGHYEIKLINGLGQLVLQKEKILQEDFMDAIFTLPGNITPGLYFFQVASPEFRIQKQVLVQ